MYITNVDSLSALFDRLIAENIKLYFFTKENKTTDAEHQNRVIFEIKKKLSELLQDVKNGHLMKMLSLKNYRN